MAKLIAARVMIRDGFTMTAVYQPSARLAYSGVEITYRPAIQDEYAEHIVDARKPLVKMRDWVAKHLVSWNVAGDDPATVAPITPETVGQLAYPLLDWMDSCINGYAPKAEGDDLKN